MAASDFLFSINADPQAADAAIAEFVKRTRSTLSNLEKINTLSSAGAAKALQNQQALLKVSEQRLSVEQKIAQAQQRNASAGVSGGGLTDISGIATRNASAIGRQKDALDFLNRIMGNTVFKFVEYELVMKAFNGSVSELFNSLNQASNVQMEMVLQRIYNAQINTNAALKDSIVIAKQWGSDITDVQQVIGLWTKQTSQMHDATGKLVDSQTALAAAAKLAADAEKFHRASGIESLEVYEKSVSLWHELGISLGEIPHLYDQIALAATKISPVLKAQPGTSAKQEGIKDIFEGVSESGATLRAQGMDDALIIATVAKQVENLGSTGAKVGNQISTMFGSLNQGGRQLQEWVKILGPDAFKDSEHFMDAAISKVNELKQAQADGLLHVKPQTMNTWRTFIETLDEVKKLADDIRGHSKGMLDVIAGAQMNTYNGEVARLRASFQELNLALGTQLLPTATRFVTYLSGTALPTLAANSSLIAKMAQAGLGLGASYLVMLGISKVSAAFAAFRAEAASAALTAQLFRNAELDTVPGMAAAEAEMLKQQAALAQLERQMGIAKWQAEGLNTELTRLGITETELAEVTGTKLPGAFAVASASLGSFAGRAAATLGPLLLLYEAMNAMQNFDPVSRMNQGVNALVHGSETGFKRVTDSLGDASQMTRPDTNLAFDMMTKIRKGGGPEAKQLNDALWTVLHSKDNTAKTDAGALITALVDEKYDTIHHKNVAGYDQLAALNKQIQDEMNRAMGGNPLGMTMPGDLGKGKSPRLATEQQIAAEGVNKDKADAMAQISKWRDIDNAAASYAKTLMEVGKANGFTQETVNKLTVAFKVQNDAIYNGEAATKKEITSLEAQKKSLEGLIAKHGGTLNPITGKISGGDKTSAIYAEGKAWRMAQEAIEKATGALAGYESKKAALALERQQVNEAQAWASASQAFNQGRPSTIGSSATHFLSFLDFNIAGTKSASNPFSNPDAFKAFMQTFDDALSHTSSTIQKLNVSSSQVTSLQGLAKGLETLYNSLKNTNPQQAAVIASMLTSINDAGKKAAASLKEAAKSDDEFNHSLADMASNLSAKNAGDIGKLLGLDDGSLEAQQTFIDGYPTINDELTKLNEMIKQEGGSYAALDASQKSMVAGYIQQVELQKQMLPLLAQQEEIQSSIAYKATEAALQKAGEAQLDATIDRLMGHSNNAATRKQAYDNAVSGQSMSAMQSLFKDYLTNVVQNWWSQTVKWFTNQMFGDPAAKARALEEQMLKTNRDGLTTILQDTKTQVVDALNVWEGKFAKDVDKFTGATTPGSAPGGGNTSPQGTDENPTVIAAQGDGTGGFLSGQTSRTGMSQAVADGLDNSEVLDKIQAHAETTADAITQPSTGGGSGGGSGSNLLQGLLGPFGSAVPGLSKYLSSNGSWLNSIASSGAQGFGIGSMIGGAGSTNSDFGAIGGVLGQAAAFIPGIGPALAAALPALGGIFGGIFGHQDDPSKMPDKYDTQNYGKFVANINGRPGSFNGVTIGPDPQFSVAGGQHGMGYQMIAWAQKNPNDPLAKQIIALGPQIGIASEKDGVFTLGDGKTISVTAYEQLGQQWQAKAQNQSNAPIISVNSYGGGSAAGAYGTPGMTSSEFQSEEQAWASGVGGGNTGGAWTAPPLTGGNGGGGGGGGTGPNIGGGMGINARATPGYGDRGSNLYGGAVRTDLRLQVVLTTPVNLDGKKVTELVNAYNAQMRSDGGHFGGASGHDPYQ